MKSSSVDKDAAKIATLKSGKLPIYEPGLFGASCSVMAASKRLTFSTDLPAAVKDAQLIFIAVGTPGRPRPARRTSSARLGGRRPRGGTFAPRCDRRHQEHRDGRHQPEIDGTDVEESGPANRGCQQSGIPQRRRRHRRFHEARPRRGRSAPPRSGPEASGTLFPISAHGTAVSRHVPRERRDDEIRRQRHARHQDQLHQRDGQSL